MCVVRSPEIVPCEGHNELLLAPVGTETAATAYKLSLEVDCEQSCNKRKIRSPLNNMYDLCGSITLTHLINIVGFLRL